MPFLFPSEKLKFFSGTLGGTPCVVPWKPISGVCRCLRKDLLLPRTLPERQLSSPRVYGLTLGCAPVQAQAFLQESFSQCEIASRE